jgi:hypothetical protein
MNLNELATAHLALEKVDTSEFQRKARILQSIWREKMHAVAGEHQGKSGSRPLGSRLQMPWAEESLANYLTPVIKEVVRSEVLDLERSAGKLFAKPRIFNDLLSSQPMAFNLFAELQQDLELCSHLLEKMTLGRYKCAEAVEFEYSPGRRDPTFTGDKSAFDVFIKCRDTNEASAFLGIEVKYHENLKNKPAVIKDRHREISGALGCFSDGSGALLEKQPLQQIWRDHLLAGSMLGRGDYSSGAFVFLYPEGNRDCHSAITNYQSILSDRSTLEVWTLEGIVECLKGIGEREWVRLFAERYLAFNQVDDMMIA